MTAVVAPATLDRDRCRRVADLIEEASRRDFASDLGFNMSQVFARDNRRRETADNSFRRCGTVACIAGWVLTEERLRPPTEDEVRIGSSASRLDELLDEAALLLGMGEGQDPDGACTELFVPERETLEQVSAGHAVRVLRHLADEGVVDWEECR